MIVRGDIGPLYLVIGFLIVSFALTCATKEQMAKYKWSTVILTLIAICLIWPVFVAGMIWQMSVSSRAS